VRVGCCLRGWHRHPHLRSRPQICTILDYAAELKTTGRMTTALSSEVVRGDVARSLVLVNVSGLIPHAPPGFRKPLRVTISLRRGGGPGVACRCPGGLPPWLVVLDIQSCRGPARRWLVHSLHLH